jgi:hypothetical protein
VVRLLVTRTHGRSGTAEYFAWVSMRQSCLNRTAPTWPRCGGRGIKVCERWNSFENFLADMGPRPSPDHIFVRIDAAADFSPENCHWQTRSEWLLAKPKRGGQP